MTATTIRAEPSAHDNVRGRPAAQFRFAAAALAFFLCLGIALAFVVVAAMVPTDAGDLRTLLLIAALAVGLGTIVGPWVAWTSCVHVLTDGRPLRRTVVRLAADAVVAGAVLVAVVGALTSAGSAGFNAAFTLPTLADAVIRPIAGVAASMALVFSFGLLLFGLPALVMTIPIVAVWVRVLQAVARQSGLAIE